MPEPTRVVYLLGAGATQAEIQRINISKSLLMGDINERILPIASQDPEIKEMIKYFLHADPRYQNIEHLISLIETLEVKQYSVLANKLRHLFHEDIQNTLKEGGNYIVPNLAQTLLTLHSSSGVLQKEKLQGIISLNYDSLIDIAYQKVYEEVNYSIYCNSSQYKISEKMTEIPPLLKIHGSFNWRKGNPVIVSENEPTLDETTSLWIPPSVTKRIENYPFNYLWGKAFELLNCDKLRIIGCSLNQNDWGLLSLLFRTQFSQDKPYDIELIDHPSLDKNIRKKYAFLKNIISLKDSKLSLNIFSEDEFDENDEFIGTDINFFERWLKRLIKAFEADIIEREKREKINQYLGESLL